MMKKNGFYVLVCADHNDADYVYEWTRFDTADEATEAARLFHGLLGRNIWENTSDNDHNKDAILSLGLIPEDGERYVHTIESVSVVEVTNILTID